MWDAGRFVAQGQSGVDSYRGRFLSGYLGYETRLRWRIMSLKPRPVPTMFSPPWTRRTPSPVTLPIKILKRDKRLVNRCTVKETPRLRMENFHWLRPRFESSDDRLFGDFVIFSLSFSRYYVSNRDDGGDIWKFFEFVESSRSILYKNFKVESLLWVDTHKLMV